MKWQEHIRIAETLLAKAEARDTERRTSMDSNATIQAQWLRTAQVHVGIANVLLLSELEKNNG